jgi:serine protease Do
MLIWLTLALAPVQDTSGPDPAASRLVEEMDSVVQRVIDVAGKAVVTIRVDREPEPRDRARGAAAVPFQNRPVDSACSGVVIDPEGYIVTTLFNVEGVVKKIEVTLPTGELHEAQLLGYDAPLDIALLKIPARNLPTLKYADLKQVGVGQMVVVLGRNPEGGGVSVAPGIVSALERFAGRMVQTDAKANYSNAGGPLVDWSGRLIGILCKVHTRYASTYGQNSGVAFAATWDKIAEALPRLKQGARVREERRPFLGVSYDRDAEGVDGVPVAQVIPGTAADKAGLKVGDTIIEFDGSRVRAHTDLLREINKRKAGDRFKIKVLREGLEVELDVTLGERVVEE